MTTRYVYRSAVSGLFVTQEYARKNPATTMRTRIKSTLSLQPCCDPAPAHSARRENEMANDKKNQGKTQEELERDRDEREEPEVPVYPPGDEDAED